MVVSRRARRRRRIGVAAVLLAAFAAPFLAAAGTFARRSASSSSSRSPRGATTTPPAPATRVVSASSSPASSHLDAGADPDAATPAPAKVAFLFLAPANALPHEALWARFFEAQPPALFTVRVHASGPPGSFETAYPALFPPAVFVPDPATGVDDRGTRPRGALARVRAEKKLLSAALEDARVRACVLNDDHVVPLRDFPFARKVILQVLLADGGDRAASFVEAAVDRTVPTGAGDDPLTVAVARALSRARKEKKFTNEDEDEEEREQEPSLARADDEEDAPGPLFSRFDWRVGAFAGRAMTRRHAMIVATDATVFAAFERACEGGTEGEAESEESASSESASSESASSSSSSSSSSSAAVLDALRFARCSNAPRYYAPTLLSHLGASLERRVTTYENWWPTTRKVPKRYAAQEARAAFVDVQKKTSRDALLDGGGGAAAAFSRACGRFRSGPAARWDPRDEGAVMPCWLFAARFTPRAGAKIARFAATRAGYR